MTKKDFYLNACLALVGHMVGERAEEWANGATGLTERGKKEAEGIINDVPALAWKMVEAAEYEWKKKSRFAPSLFDED
jgi:hypothetical protein